MEALETCCEVHKTYRLTLEDPGEFDKFVCLYVWIPLLEVYGAKTELSS